MQQYRIIRINPTVETAVDRKPKFDPNTGERVGYEEIPRKFVIAYATDGILAGDRRGNVLMEYPIASPLGCFEVGDIVEAFPSNNGWLQDVNIIKGKNAILAPAPPQPAPPMQPLPQSTTPQLTGWRLSASCGCPLSNQDLGQLGSALVALEQKVEAMAVDLRKIVAERQGGQS